MTRFVAVMDVDVDVNVAIVDEAGVSQEVAKVLQTTLGLAQPSKHVCRAESGDVRIHL
jgi:hypothetical protein